MAILGFEGAVSIDGFTLIPASYGGLTWNAEKVAVMGRDILINGYGYLYNSGVGHVLDGDVVAFSSGAPNDDVVIGGQSGAFSLIQGVFASAWRVGETLRFKAYIDGVLVGSKTFTVDQSAQTIVLGHHFKHVDQVVITAKGGSDVDPSDNGTGTQFGFDDLVVKFDKPAPTIAAADPAASHAAEDWVANPDHFVALHHGDWML